MGGEGFGVGLRARAGKRVEKHAGPAENARHAAVRSCRGDAVPGAAATGDDVTQTAKKALVVGIIVVVVAGVASWRAVSRRPAPRTREIAGATIRMLDVARQTAEVEFAHPKTGRRIRLTGTLAPGCEILVDGQPATLADLRVGDLADVHGTVYPDYSVQADRVRVYRAATVTRPVLPQSQPATTSSGGS
jgi:hypothetical protein